MDYVDLLLGEENSNYFQAISIIYFKGIFIIY